VFLYYHSEEVIMSAWLKSGLIGAVVVIVLNLIGLVPGLVCITAPLALLAYLAVGVLAASYMPPRREAGAAAGQGALAAVLAGLCSGVVSMVINLIRAGTGGMFQYTQVLRSMPPEVAQQFRDLGVGPDVLAGAGGIGGVAICGSVCCLTGIVFAAILGAIGAAIYAAVKPE
jgi:hypothetical protein